MDLKRALAAPPCALMPTSEDERVMVVALAALDLGPVRIYDVAEVWRVHQSSN